MTRRGSIAGQLFALQVLVVTLLVGGGTAGAVLLARRDAHVSAIQEVVAVAESVARAPSVVSALHTANPTAVLQPYTESIRTAARTDFVVVMGPDRTRYTHPNPALIGKPFAGSVAAALAGGRVIEQYRGSLGDSVRAVVPVRDPGRHNAIIGLVSVGITTAAINRTLLDRLPGIAAATGAALLLAAAGSWLLSRRLRRQTHGLGPAAMTRMVEYYDAVLHAVREGLLVVDRAGTVTLINDEGRRLLGLDEGQGLPPEIAELIASRRPTVDEPILAGDRVLVASQRVTRFEGRTLGTVLTLRDHTELRALTSELDSVRGLTQALQAQAHEAANRLHTVLSMIELGRTDKAVELATAELTVAQQLADQVMAAVDEPALAALLLGKSAQAAERGAELTLEPGSRLDDDLVPSGDLLTVVGNLIDNALEAIAATPPPRRVRVLVQQADNHILVRVSDTGRGLSEQQTVNAFRRGWTTKPGEGRGIGLSLVRQVADRHGGDCRIEAADGGGTVLTVRIPVRP